MVHHHPPRFWYRRPSLFIGCLILMLRRIEWTSGYSLCGVPSASHFSVPAWWLFSLRIASHWYSLPLPWHSSSLTDAAPEITFWPCNATRISSSPEAIGPPHPPSSLTICLFSYQTSGVQAAHPARSGTVGCKCTLSCIGILTTENLLLYLRGLGLLL